MGLVAQIASSIGVGVHRSGQADLIAVADVVRFLEAARSHNLRVLGLEGFHFVGGRLVPDMDAIADFSSVPGSASSEETVAEALRFLSNIGKLDLLYDVTLREQAD